MSNSAQMVGIFGDFNVYLFVLAAVAFGGTSLLFASSADRLQERLNWHPVLAGMLLISIGASLPELLLALLLNFSPTTYNIGSTLSTGVLTGTTIAELALALGLAAVVVEWGRRRTMVVERQISTATIMLAGVAVAGAVILFCILIFAPVTDNAFMPFEEGAINNPTPILGGPCGQNNLTGCSIYPWWLGLALLVAFGSALVFLYLLRRGHQFAPQPNEDNMLNAGMSRVMLTFVFITSFATVGVLALFLVDQTLGIIPLGANSEYLIYVVFIIGLAFFCALPEVIVAFSVAKGARTDLLAGALIGSTVFDLFFIHPALVLSQKLFPKPTMLIPRDNGPDIPYGDAGGIFAQPAFLLANKIVFVPIITLLFLSIIVFLFYAIARRLRGWHGWVLIALYFVFGLVLVFVWPALDRDQIVSPLF